MSTGNPALSFQALRGLAGLSPEEAAAGAGLDVEALLGAEHGEVDPVVLAKIAELYGVATRALERGTEIELPSSGQLSFFSFRGDVHRLSQTDLPFLHQAADYAREWLRSPDSEEGLLLRLRQPTVKVRGPRNRDAAIQGVRLARALRGALGLAGDPITDIRAIVEERLGLVVLVHDMKTIQLQAGAVRDQGRSAAAILLRSDLEPWHQRTAIAHEICHLVYDPPTPERLDVALDTIERTPPWEDVPRYMTRPESWTPRERMECRARSFSAEFQLPMDGLTRLLGAPRNTDDDQLARELILEACQAFGTYWEMTTNHLDHRGFISHGARDRLYREQVELPPPPATSLPDADAPPLCLQARRQEAQASHVASQHARREAARVEEALEIQISEAARLIVDELFADTHRDPMGAGIRLASRLDRALREGKASLMIAAFEHINPRTVNTEAIVGVLSVVSPACQSIGGQFVDAFNAVIGKTVGSMRDSEEWSESDIKDVQEMALK